MNIKPFAASRKYYNDVSNFCKQTSEPVYLCKQTREPVFLTKDGEGDLVVMDIETYSRRESMLELRESLLCAEEDRLAGKPVYTVAETAELMRAAVEEAKNV